MIALRSVRRAADVRRFIKFLIVGQRRFVVNGGRA